ncbi:FecCD family ABC transporter permease [Halalkalibacter oceani]|uniref:Probable heme-iron transport system permease protein IsdF n=1 Tax=Halalkalibacter oceani TaxID=1653776 RepID=A0A9X2INR1_9BACI|nr:iron ABC transporter permease [Halalkalibacter oceani]MCM3714051.1 iron ABC transporter permease [Halalkalibacter oceani]
MQKQKIIWSFVSVSCLLVVVSLFSATTGSLQVTITELIKGFISEPNETVLIIKDLRFPRIIISLFTGAALAVSGVLLQAVMRNPLAEAGIIGVAAGSRFVFLLIVTAYPMTFFYAPLFAFIGGALACFLVYAFSWKSGLSPLRMILVGVAVNAVFTGLNQSFIYFVGYSSVTHATVSSLAMKTWSEVDLVLIYGSLGLILSLFLTTWCNVLALQDKTARNLGFQLSRLRLIISAVAVLLAAVATAVAGVIAFVGLLVPHIARQIVGTDHKVLIPFSALAGALLVLTADTLGRLVIAPNEIPASIIMAVIGGPFLIFMLRKSDRIHGS